MQKQLSICCCVLLCVSASVVQADWPAWRGPDSNAVAPAGEYPIEFGPGKNERWSVDLPGRGTSTPVVRGHAIFLTATSDDDKDTLCCYTLSGEHQWTHTLGKSRLGKHKNATGSNPSPVVDGKHVVAYFKSGNLACLTHGGEKQWEVNLQELYGKDTLWWDLATSPVLTPAGVCIAVMQAGDSYLVTLDLESGQEVWKQPREYKRPKESDQSYTTPAVVELDGQLTLVTWGADHLTGHDPATGKLLWELSGFNPDNQPMWRVIASATIADGWAYVPYGRAEHMAGVPLGESPGAERWDRHGIGADVPCPIVHQGKVYVLGDKGEVTCLDAIDGHDVWSGKLPRGRGKYYSSPLLANGHLYCVREDGAAFVANITNGLQVVAENDLRDDSVSTPVPVKDGLLMRTRTKLYLFGEG